MTTTGAHPGRVARGSVAEWVFDARGRHPNPYTDVVVAAEFRGPGGQVRSIEGFYDGQRFRVRFSPDEEGTWQVRVVSRPHDDGLCLEAAFEVLPGTGGPARVAPGTGWGFTDARGRPLFVLGDTAYHLFGMAHCGADVAGYLRRRREQGFDLVRVRVPVSPFHPPNGHNDWQTRSCWPWGGSPQHPLFDRFDAAWFATVDRVVAEASRIGIGLELVVEGWGTEFPFNARGTFTAEWEDLWLRHLVARYDAWDSVWIWTLMNEYEFYPDGVPRYDRVADLWALRMARRLKQLAPHGKAVAVHNGPPGPPFAERFAVDPGAIDAVMVQSWGSHDAREGWLATGLETRIGELLDGWRGSALLSEYGYERNPALPLNLPLHEFCDVEHTRRGAWRGAMSGLGVVHGFDNTWGPFLNLQGDQEGVAALLHLARFFREHVAFHRLRPAPALITGPRAEEGRSALALHDPADGTVVVYLPVGGSARLTGLSAAAATVRDYDPRTGVLSEPRVQSCDLPFGAADATADDLRDHVLLITPG
ncbi:apiosidase-like domain-containing protein [Kitasatospora cineracea]|uniref:apiosidase-like domain-containing protein n=1 Tax=Kitasatospora cineracea TaxID=88074 RepID=UPI003698B604